MTKRKHIDWEAIEREYRMGQKTMRNLASEFNVNVSNISRRAKKEKWVQDKSEEVRNRTNAALVAQQKRNTPTIEDIEKAVETNIHVIRSHQSLIRQQITIIKDLLLKLNSITENDIQKKIKFQTLIVKELSFATKNLIPLERQAFNIGDSIEDKEFILKVKYEDGNGNLNKATQTPR